MKNRIIIIRLKQMKGPLVGLDVSAVLKIKAALV